MIFKKRIEKNNYATNYNWGSRSLDITNTTRIVIGRIFSFICDEIVGIKEGFYLIFRNKIY